MELKDWQALNRQVIARALKDPAYRQALLADPRATLGQAFGQELPPNIRVKVVEQEPDTIYLLLPHGLASAELSEEELDSVAGGLLATSYPPRDEPGRP
jgi:nitrile hydratase alpha subunit